MKLLVKEFSFVACFLLTLTRSLESDNCPHHGDAELKLHISHPSEQNSIDITLGVMLIPSQKVEMFLHSSKNQLLPLCAEHVKQSHNWTPQHCLEDLMSQLSEYISKHCDHQHVYQPNSFDECRPLKDLEVPPPPKYEDNGLNIEKPTWMKMLPVVLEARKKSNWNMYYQDVVQFFKDEYYPKSNHIGGEEVKEEEPSLTIVEVGTMFGGLANVLTGNLRNSHIYAVDPFLPLYDENDGAGFTQANMANQFEANHEQFSVNMSMALSYAGHQNHGCRFHQIRAFSKDAARVFEDNSLDSVFIDGLHTYEGVSTDIIAWKRKLKKDTGCFVFNDVYYIPPVTQALNDFLVGFGLEMVMGAHMKPPGFDNGAVFFRNK